MNTNIAEGKSDDTIIAPDYAASDVSAFEDADSRRNDLKWRTDFLLVTLSAFFSGFLFFGCIFAFAINASADSVQNLAPQPNGFVIGLMFGYMISGIIGGIMLAASFFSGKSRLFKILSAVFFIITYFCVAAVGLYGIIPYQIYNIIKVISLKKALSAPPVSE